ncbi:hypothetical protein HR10_01510 [Porphyromonas gulae]|nr:hypothetical protein HR10_01510 [Porphyromonas gulae]
MNVSINGVRKSYWPKLGCAMNKGIDSAAKGSDENAVRESLSELGYTGTFGKRGNVRQEICIAEPKKVAPRWRKLFRCGLVALQLGGSNCGATLSCSKLEEGFSERTCRPPSRSSEFRVRLAGLHAEQSALQSRNANSPADNDTFPTKKVAATCGNTSLTRKSFPQVAGSFFVANLSSRKLRRGFSARRCFPATCGNEFRVRLAGLHAEQSALQNRNADSRRTMTLSRPKRSIVLLLERSEEAAVGMPVIFALPMTCENHRLKNRSAYGSKRGIPYLWPYQIERFL